MCHGPLMNVSAFKKRMAYYRFCIGLWGKRGKSVLNHGVELEVQTTHLLLLGRPVLLGVSKYRSPTAYPNFHQRYSNNLAASISHRYKMGVQNEQYGPKYSTES
jgi:hypothetical protein